MPALRFLWMVLIGLLTLPTSIIAQSLPADWEQTAGPPGGTFLVIAQDPASKNLWASVEGAIYFSLDEGASWTLALAEDLGKTPFAFDGTSIFAGPFVSHDAGLHWQRHQLPDSLIIQDYAFDPTSNSLFVATNGGLFSSSDAGATWTKRISTNVRRIWSFDGQYLFAAPATHMPWWLHSADNGENWVTYRLGTPVSVTRGPDNVLFLMSFSARDNEIIFNRIRDFSIPWLSGGPSTCDGRELIGFTQNQEMLFLNDGIVKLTIEENSRMCNWVYLNQKDFNSSTIQQPVQAWLLGYDDVLYLDTGFGEFIKSPTDDVAWEQMEVKGIVGTSVHAITIDQETGEVWAGTALHGLFKTSDGGNTWTNEGFKGHVIEELSIGNTSPPQWLASDQDGLLTWNQETQSWPVYAPDGLQLSPFPPIYDAYSQTYFFKTNNNVFYRKAGEDALTGIPTPVNFFATPAIAAITLGPEGVLYGIIRHKAVLREKGFFRLTNPTGAWELVSENFPGAFIEESLLLTDSSNRLWATSDSTLYLSENFGKTWIQQEISTGLINDILETPDSTIWVAHARGLLRLEHGANAWAPAETGLRHKAVLSLAWHEKRGLLLAGTHKGGLYKIALAPPVEVSNQTIQHENRTLKAGHFPNPVASTATIHFTLASPEWVRIQLFDYLGREVRQLTSAQFSAGKHQIDVAFDALSPGVYLYKIETPTAQHTQLITHIR